MPLKACRECGREVSTEAATCPHCGAAAPTRERTKKWVPCPKCGSAKTRREDRRVLMGGVSFLSAGCLLWLPVIGWVLAAILLVVALLSWIAALIPTGKTSFHCLACKQWFAVPNGELAARK